MHIRKRVRGNLVRWELAYTDRMGKRRAPNFPRQKDAEAAMKQITTELQLGIHTPTADSVTVSEAGELWLKQVEARGREPSTISQYKGHLHQHLVPLIGRQQLAKLTTPLCVALADELTKRLTQITARKVLTSFKSIITEAQRRGLIAANPALPAKIELLSRHDPDVTIPPKAEINKMIDAATGRWRPLLITAVFTGLRASELRGLRWIDVDLDRRRLDVRQRADNRNSMGSPKSKASRRQVPLSPMVVNALREWKLACPKGDRGLVFPNTLGTTMHITDIGRLFWLPLLAKCDLPAYDFHVTRHIAASLMIEQGATPKRIQTVLGHSSIRITFDTYGHLFENAEADQVMMAGAEKALFGL